MIPCALTVKLGRYPKRTDRNTFISGTRGTLLMTFVSSVHNPKIMLGMLVKVLRGDSIATRRRLPREGNVTFEDLRRVASDFDVRTVAIAGLTLVRYLLSITVRVVTVIATTRSAGLSWSHDTCCIDEKLNRYPMRAYRNTSVAEADGVAPLFCTASRSLAPARYMGSSLSPTVFWGNAPPKSTSFAPSPA